MLHLHARRLVGGSVRQRLLAPPSSVLASSTRLPTPSRVAFARFQSSSNSTAATAPSTTTAATNTVHKPVPAKVKRKTSTRNKKKHPPTTAAAIASKLNGSASVSGSSSTAAKTAATATTNSVERAALNGAKGATTSHAVNGNKQQQQSDEEAALARAAKQSSSSPSHRAKPANGSSSSSAATDNNNSKSLNGSASSSSSSVRYKKPHTTATAAASSTTLENDTNPSSHNNNTSDKTTTSDRKPTTIKDARVDKITLTLQEIATLQKTLPSVDEIATLVAKLRNESFAKGHLLFDLYRNYGNPFLDEHFLIPGVLACCEAKKPADGLRIVNDMLNQGRKVDEATLRALFDVCDTTSSAPEAIELWGLMARAGSTVTLKDLNRLLDICYRTEYLDGAIQVLKSLRLLRPVSVNTYMHWLLRASLVWRSDAFFDILMEMRLAGVEPEISSLTSLETGRKDRALTVMEGVRAVGLDPCFAMSSVFSSMQASVYGNGPDIPDATNDPLSPRALKHAKSKFGDLAPLALTWPVQPIPQLLETQAAGLILQQETFRRLKRHQVNRIDELLQMLPITANMTLNLRKQLQRMSLLVNTHRVRRSSRQISDEYAHGESLIALSSAHNYPPVSLMRIILRARGLNTLQIQRALKNPSEHLAKRDAYEIRKAVEYDSVHKSDPFIGTPSYNAESLEVTIEHFLKAKGIRVKTQEDLCKEQLEQYGRRVISPDILLLDPVIVNGTPIRWIDAKNYYGAHIVSKRLISKQLASYVKEWGPGAIVFGMGYSDMFAVPGVICLDTTPFPKTRKETVKMRVKSLLYSGLNLFRWKKHLGSALTQEYPPHASYPHSPTINAKTPSSEKDSSNERAHSNDERDTKTTKAPASRSMLARQTTARVMRAAANTQTRQVSGLVNKPSHVAQDQQLFTTSHKHTYVKRSSDKMIYGGLLALTGFGFLQFFRGELHMANGTGKKE